MGSTPSTEVEPEKTGEGEPSISRIPVKRFGEYNLIGRLGFGGMAEVFLAFTAGPGGVRKLVVVKRLHRHLREAKDFVRMFLDEARLAAQLNHPNIVQTYELGDINGSYFMAMEYLQGQSFDRVLRLSDRGDPIVWNQIVARVVCDALDGLEHAHTFRDIEGKPLGIIHRDVSPQNIFVTYEGLSKVLDFGVAKAATQMDATESGVLKGKCSYVAPEQAYGEKVDHRADLWAMGVVLWEAIAGRRLFKSETNAATLLEVLTAEIPLIMDIAPHTSLALGQVLEKSLQRDPRNRYSSAREMRRDLQQFLREVPEPISRREVGEFLSRRFADIRAKQQKVVEECLADALASRLPRAKKRGPDLKRMPASKSISRLISTTSTTDDISEPLPRPSPTSSSSQVEILVQGDLSASNMTPISGHSSPPFIDGEASQPSWTPGVVFSPSIPPPRSELRQKVAFGLLALALAVVAAVVVAVTFQRCQGAGRAGVDEPQATGSVSPAPVAPPAPVARGGGAQGRLEHDPPAEPERTNAGAAPAPSRSGDAGGAEPGAEPGRHDEEAPSRSRASRRRRHRVARQPLEHRTPVVEAAREEGPPEGAAPASSEQGYLTLDTTPWTRVSLGGRDLGTTPIVHRPVPAGTHLLRLRNEEEGISSTYRVVIRPGETTVRRLGVR